MLLNWFVLTAKRRAGDLILALRKTCHRRNSYAKTTVCCITSSLINTFAISNVVGALVPNVKTMLGVNTGAYGYWIVVALSTMFVVTEGCGALTHMEIGRLFSLRSAKHRE